MLHGQLVLISDSLRLTQIEKLGDELSGGWFTSAMVRSLQYIFSDSL